jgi:hypothetical protein
VSPPTFWLSFHAPYACRHSGACCSSGWDIAVEKGGVAAISSAVRDRRIAAPAIWLTQVDGAPADIGGILRLAADGRCVFHGAGCAIHSALGHAALPAACRHFPRVALIDGRGVFVTLSHYCPTAASLLLQSKGGTQIIEGPPALPDDELPEGLDARDALPPLRHPRMLMDLESYGAWERSLVTALAGSDSPEDVLDATAGRRVQLSDQALFAIAKDSVPAPYTWPDYVASGDAGPPPADIEGRYLTAHAFACWMAYQGNSLLSIVIYLRVVLAVLRAEVQRRGSVLEGIRQSDLLLRHLADREALAARISSLAAGNLPGLSA